jgi:hypothetical protein
MEPSSRKRGIQYRTGLRNQSFFPPPRNKNRAASRRPPTTRRFPLFAGDF